MKQLFDMVIIDAKLDFKGMEFGGLRLADELRPRYGSQSILVVSRFITRSIATVSPSYGSVCASMSERSYSSLSPVLIFVAGA